MKPETFVKTKSDLEKFFLLVKEYADLKVEYFPRYMIIAILVQNAGFNAYNCQGFNQQKAEEELYAILKMLKHFKEYYHEDFEEWVYEEVSDIITGNEMSEDLI